jgi:hypothetical protein
VTAARSPAAGLGRWARPLGDTSRNLTRTAGGRLPRGTGGGDRLR